MRGGISAVIFATAFLMAIAAGLAPQSASAIIVDVQLNWTAPTTGSPVVLYIVQLETDGGDWVDCCTAAPPPAGTPPFAVIALSSGHVYRARVAGRDARMRQGPWSEPSLPYQVDEGAPGQCGQIVFPSPP